MADNYLITGYWGEAHVTAENDRGINAGIFGTGRFVLPVGEQFMAEYIGNNTIRMYDGKLMDNGAAAGIPAGEYVDLLIANAGQDMKRNDLIVFQYKQDASTLIESGQFVVVQGSETSGTPSDPTLTQGDLLSNKATFDQMALWRVPVSGTVISAPVRVFEVSKSIKNAGASVAEATSSNGVAYSATVPGITELYAGLEITIIPNRNSASTAITLDINGFGAKNVRLPVSTNTAMLAQPDTETYFVEGRAVKMMYDTKFASKGAWVAVDRQRQSGSDIYGSVPIEHGGTGADNAEDARINLGVPHAIESTEYPGCYYRIVKAISYGEELDKEETEWFKPPIEIDVEYRTTERLYGYVVYTKLMHIGKGPNNTEITKSCGMVFRIQGYGASGVTPMFSLPLDSGGQKIHCGNYDSSIYIASNFDASMYDIYTQVWYIKPGVFFT